MGFVPSHSIPNAKLKTVGGHFRNTIRGARSYIGITQGSWKIQHPSSGIFCVGSRLVSNPYIYILKERKKELSTSPSCTERWVRSRNEERVIHTDGFTYTIETRVVLTQSTPQRCHTPLNLYCLQRHPTYCENLCSLSLGHQSLPGYAPRLPKTT